MKTGQPYTSGKWRGQPEFQTLLAGCVALCDDFAGTDYALAGAVGI